MPMSIWVESYSIDVETCPHYGSFVKFIACAEDQKDIDKKLFQLKIKDRLLDYSFYDPATGYESTFTVRDDNEEAQPLYRWSTKMWYNRAGGISGFASQYLHVSTQRTQLLCQCLDAPGCIPGQAILSCGLASISWIV